MFRNWLKENKVEDFDYLGSLFPKACERSFWQDKYDDKYIVNAEKFLDYSWPTIKASYYLEFYKSCNRVIMEKVHFERRFALSSLILGELLEYKGRFISDIVDGIFAICEESFWGISAHHMLIELPKRENEKLPDVTNPFIDLFAAETAELISVVYYLFYNELYEFCPEMLTRIENEIDKRIIKPYLSRKDFWWMGYYRKINNWNPWILSNLLTVFLLTVNNKTSFYNGLNKMFYEINHYYAGMPSDGGCDEGSTYWTVAGGKLLEFCDQLYLATAGKINFFNDEKLQNIGKYIYRVYIGNGYSVNFADGSPRINENISSALYIFGQRIGDIRLSVLSKESASLKKKTGISDNDIRIKRFLNDIIFASEIESMPDYESEESFMFTNLQNAFVRKGKWYYAAKGGHNAENHNHNDIGSFIAYYDNKPVLVDPSCGVYTKDTFVPATRYKIWTMRSDWHNLPVVNGKLQKDGPMYRADNFELNNNTCEISYAKAYEDGTNLEELSRRISVFDNGIEINDEFVFVSENNTVAEHFITPLSVKIKENGVVIGGEFVLTTDCDTEIVVENQEFFGDKKLTSYWNTDSMNRIIFKTIADDKKFIKFNLRRL